MGQNAQAGRDEPVHVHVVVPVARPHWDPAGPLEWLQSPWLKVTASTLPRGPASIECDYDIVLAAPAIVAATCEAERQGADAVVIDCMADPGIEAGRECVDIPVLGAFQVSVHVASMLSHRFAVLTVLPRSRIRMEDLAARYGLQSNMVACRSFDIPVLELERSPERTRAKLLETAVRAIEDDGAHALVFGCTGLLGHAEALRRSLLAAGHDVPVIDPLPTTIRCAAAIARSGLSHSKLSSGNPPPKERHGFEGFPFVAAQAGPA